MNEMLNSLRSRAGWIVSKARITLKYKYPFSPFNRISLEDQADFARVLETWRPKNGKAGVLLKWLVTTWCNYQCPYCPQEHGRKRKVRNYMAHSFDNHDVSKWLYFLEKHFCNVRLALVLTGGEVMLDTKNMPYLLRQLVSRDWIDNIRIDTNASWDPSKYEGIDLSKIWLMCTFHPSQIEESKFIAKIKLLYSLGYKIGMVNYVMYGNQVAKFEEKVKVFADMGVPLHPNPLWGSNGKFTEDALSILKKYLHPIDLQYRGGLVSPYGQKCLFPSIAYEVNQDGYIYIGCHMQINTTIFSEKIPKLPAGPVPCPFNSCTCLFKYSFLKGINRNTTLNPFLEYCELLMDRISKSAKDYVEPER